MIDQLLTTTAIAAVEQGAQHEAFFGFLLGAALSVGAALLNKPKAPPAPPPVPVPTPAPAPQIVKVVETKTTPNLEEAVETAKAAGFNPATAAAYGLLQGFTTQQTPFLTTNPKYVTWQSQQDYNTQNYNRTLQIQQDQYNYQQQKRSWASGLLSTGAGLVTGFQNYRSNQVRTGLQNDLLRSEIYRNNSLGTRNYATANSISAGSRTEWYNPIKTTQPVSGNPTDWKDGDVNVTNPWPNHTVDPNRADAEAVETRYGEIAAEGYGLFNVGADLYHNYFGSGSNTSGGASNYPVRFVTANNRNNVSTSGFNPQVALPQNTGSGGGW